MKTSAHFECAKSIQVQIFFWSLFSHIQNGHEDWLCKSPNSVRILENADHKRLWRTFYAVFLSAYVLNAGIYWLWSLSKTVILTRWILYFLVFYATYICCIVKYQIWSVFMKFIRLLFDETNEASLTLTWVGFLGLRGNYPPLPQSKTCYNYARDLEFGISRHPYLVSENISFSTKALWILLISALFAKNQHLLAKILPLVKAALKSYIRDFSSVFSFCKIKGYC